MLGLCHFALSPLSSSTYVDGFQRPASGVGGGSFPYVRVVVVLVTQSCLILFDHMDPARLLCPWDSPGKNTGVGCHSFLHDVFLT